MRAGLLQITSSDMPADNIAMLRLMLAEAAANGAGFVLTPEVTNCVSLSRAHQNDVLQTEADDITLSAMREEAARHGVWLLLGSLALKTDDKDGRFANRSFLITPEGEIAARYDKIHMFDVDVTPQETFRESDGFRSGNTATLANTPFGAIGMSICYDLRFAGLYRALAQAGAQVLTIPAAFSPVTGAAHWMPLMRARAIETGCYVLAPAQTGTHANTRGKTRYTHGHSVAIAPWGEVLADAGTDPGIAYVDLDLEAVSDARRRIPALTHDRQFQGP